MKSVNSLILDRPAIKEWAWQFLYLIGDGDYNMFVQQVIEWHSFFVYGRDNIRSCWLWKLSPTHWRSHTSGAYTHSRDTELMLKKHKNCPLNGGISRSDNLQLNLSQCNSFCQRQSINSIDRTKVNSGLIDRINRVRFPERTVLKLVSVIFRLLHSPFTTNKLTKFMSGGLHLSVGNADSLFSPIESMERMDKVQLHLKLYIYIKWCFSSDGKDRTSYSIINKEQCCATVESI